MTVTSFAIVAVTAAALSAGLHLRAVSRGRQRQVYLFKPLSTSLLVLLAAVPSSVHGSRYQMAIVVGLMFSLLGDILLMLPKDHFRYGLASFLVAHVCYVGGFTSAVPIGTAPALLLPLVAAAVPVLLGLWSRLGALRLPVLAYSATILLMTWLAWARSWVLPSPGSACAAAGAAFFVTSDAVLAWNRFRGPMRHAKILRTIAYVAGQTLIAASVSVP